MVSSRHLNSFQKNRLRVGVRSLGRGSGGELKAAKGGVLLLHNHQVPL